MSARPRPPFLRLFLDNKRHWPGLVLMVLLAFLAGIFKTRAATLWGGAVDLGVRGQIQAMLNSVVWMLLFIGLDAIRTAIHYTVIGQATERMFRDVRLRAFDTLTRADMKTLDMRSGDLSLRISEDTERLCDIIAANFSHYLRLIFQAIFAVASCVMLSWRLSIAFFILVPVSMWLFNLISKPLERLQKEARGGAGQSAGVVSDALSGIGAVKVFNMEGEMDRRFAAAVDEAFIRTTRSSRIGMGLSVTKYAISVVQTLALFLTGAFLVSRGLVTIGNVMAFVALSAYVTEAFGLADRMMVHTKQAAALSARVYEVLDLPTEQSGDAAPCETDDFVRFDRVDFAYDGAGSKMLNGLSLRVQKGQKVALVGRSGSGKSTVIRLICRLYAHEGGRLSLFGRKGEEINHSLLRRELALVSQEPCLFEGSMLENVRYGRMDATEEAVIEALRAADLWDFVAALPNGLHTRLGEFGSRLSGGQRQRLSIARALVRDAKLVLLDEATSALDTQSEREIQHALARLLEGRAAVIVAHRLTTIQNADYVYCLDAGTVTEEGTPASLYENRGYFYEICRSQDLDKKEGADYAV